MKGDLYGSTFPKPVFYRNGIFLRLTWKLGGKYALIGIVSYVCLGACAGMWVISRGIYLGVLVLSFIFGLAVPAFGSFTNNKEELVQLLANLRTC